MQFKLRITVNSIYCDILGTAIFFYFSQTSVIHFAGNLVAVRNSEVSTRSELTVIIIIIFFIQVQEMKYLNIEFRGEHYLETPLSRTMSYQIRFRSVEPCILFVFHSRILLLHGGVRTNER